jgi:hypothetical protein
MVSSPAREVRVSQQIAKAVFAVVIMKAQQYTRDFAAPHAINRYFLIRNVLLPLTAPVRGPAFSIRIAIDIVRWPVQYPFLEDSH